MPRCACGWTSTSCRSRSRSTRSPPASGRSPPTGSAGVLRHERRRRGGHERRRAAKERGTAGRLGGSERSERGGGSLNALPGKRGLRWLLLVSASLSAIAVFLLATATATTSLFAQGSDTLLVVNGVLVALLMRVVGWQLCERRRN